MNAEEAKAYGMIDDVLVKKPTDNVLNTSADNTESNK